MLSHVTKPWPPTHYYPRPPKQAQPFFQRDRRRSRVTAIIGFNCVDGVVLAADTEEVYGESHDKAYAHKLFPAERKNANLCVAGAGPGYLIDYAKDQIVAALETCTDNLAGCGKIDPRAVFLSVSRH